MKIRSIFNNHILVGAILTFNTIAVVLNAYSCHSLEKQLMPNEQEEQKQLPTISTHTDGKWVITKLTVDGNEYYSYEPDKNDKWYYNDGNKVNYHYAWGVDGRDLTNIYSSVKMRNTIEQVAGE